MRRRPGVPRTQRDTGSFSEHMVTATGDLTQLSDGVGQVAPRKSSLQLLPVARAAMRCTVRAHENVPGATVRRLSDIVFNVPYGQEWEILMRAMRDLISASSDTLSARTKQEIHRLVFGLVQDFCETEELAAVQSCLYLVVDDWVASLGISRCQRQPGAGLLHSPEAK